jgi:hypothetical protein
MMDRNITVFNGTEIIEQYQQDYSWDSVRQERDDMLKQTDMWLLVDRYNTLTTEQQTELTTYRQELRDLPSIYYDEDDYDETSGIGSKGANDAADNFPTEPDWMN